MNELLHVVGLCHCAAAHPDLADLAVAAGHSLTPIVGMLTHATSLLLRRKGRVSAVPRGQHGGQPGLRDLSVPPGGQTL